MRLASLSGAMAEYGLDATDNDFVEGTTLALTAATQRLAGELRTEFSRAVVSDIFWVDQFKIIRPNMRPQLKLSRGFVDRTQPIVIVAASTWNDLVGVAPWNQYVNMDVDLGSTQDISQFVGWDYEKGRVNVDGKTLHWWPWIKVVYTAGFTADPSDTNMFNQVQVPSWLQNLCIMGAFNLLPETLSVKETGNKTPPWALMGGYDASVAAHARYMPQATTPESSDVTEIMGSPIVLLASSEIAQTPNTSTESPIWQPMTPVPVPTGGFSTLQLIAGGSAVGGDPTSMQLQPMVSSDGENWTAYGSVLTAPGTYTLTGITSGYFGVVLQQLNTGSVTAIVQ